MLCDPMPNSSHDVFPIRYAPALARRVVAVDEYGGRKSGRGMSAHGELASVSLSVDGTLLTLQEFG